MQTYNEAKQAQDNLYTQVDALSQKLKEFPRNASGLIIESARVTEEYQSLKKQSQATFRRLQEFNKAFTKTYRNEILKNRKHK